MQGLPAGWITDSILPDQDPRPDRIDRNAANKIAGNGVAVPAVAAAIQRMARRGQLHLAPSALVA